MTDIPAPRHPSGHASHLLPDERREIQLAHLEEGLTRTQLAVRFGRSRRAVARTLEGKDFEAMRATLDAEMVQTAQRVLTGGVVSVALFTSATAAVTLPDDASTESFLQNSAINGCEYGGFIHTRPCH